MKLFPSLSRIKDISVTKKLYFIVGTMAVLIAFELLTLWFSIHTLSSVRALVGAEGLWSKAQKDGVYQLSEYQRTHNETEYTAFLNFMAVPMGDHKTRLELLKENPDMEIARQGFLEGRIHPDDIEGMIKLLRRFHDIYYIKKAIGYWSEGDSLIGQLLPLGEKIHDEINSGNISNERLNILLEELTPLNNRLTKLEDNFSYTLGEGSRWLENLILKLLFVVALTVEITGLVLGISVSRGITKGLKEINRAAKKIANGDLSERAAVYSDDEIGQVAQAMNKMTGQLVQSNKELENFAFIASHDLQEPLRIISNYSGLIQKKYKGALDPEADKYLELLMAATGRMRVLINDILDYSRIGHLRVLQTIDCNKLIQEVISDMDISLKENNTKISIQMLPVLHGYSDLKSLFQNLISNASKFKKPGVQPLIKISAEEKDDQWVFAVSDNGIGIEKVYFNQIFTIFQKLHSIKEFAGTGIGLAHCKKIVEMHGGEIWVESEPGIGTSFYFSISKKLREMEK